jgi:hypothetical protein
MNGFMLTRMYRRFLRGVRPGDPIDDGEEDKDDDGALDRADEEEAGEGEPSGAAAMAVAETQHQKPFRSGRKGLSKTPRELGKRGRGKVVASERSARSGAAEGSQANRPRATVVDVVVGTGPSPRGAPTNSSQEEEVELCSSPPR